MEPASEDTSICPACESELAPNATGCDRCGSTVRAGTTVDVNHKRRVNWRGLIDNRWVILGLMFGVTLVLGLPFLWKSRGFSTLGKIVWSVIVTLYTILFFWIFWLIMSWAYSRLAEGWP